MKYLKTYESKSFEYDENYINDILLPIKDLGYDIEISYDEYPVSDEHQNIIWINITNYNDPNHKYTIKPIDIKDELDKLGNYLSKFNYKLISPKEPLYNSDKYLHTDIRTIRIIFSKNNI